MVSQASRPKVTTFRRKIHGSKCARRYRQSPLEYAFAKVAKVSRPPKPKVTTFPRKIHGSKSARGYRQSPLEHAPAKVARVSRPPETKSDNPSTQNPRVQKRAPLQSPLEHALAQVSRPPRPKVTTFPRKIHGSKSARRYRQSPLEHAPAKVSRRDQSDDFPHRYRQSPLEYALVVGLCTLLGEFVGVHCLMCIGSCWCTLLGEFVGVHCLVCGGGGRAGGRVRWSAGGRAGERACGRAAAAGVQAKNKKSHTMMWGITIRMLNTDTNTDSNGGRRNST